MLLGGAALTRSYVERDLREVYEGRVFYGRDAFEGLHTHGPAHDHEAHRASGTPTSAACPSGRVLPAARPRPASATASTCPRRSPDVAARQPRVRAAVPRQPRREGPVARRHRRVRQRDRAVPQPVAVPAREAGREPTTSSRPASGPRSASSSPTAKASGVLVPQVVYGYFAGQRRRRRPGRLGRRGARPAELARFHYPRQHRGAVPVHRRLLPPGRVAARPTTPRSTSSRWARRVSEEAAKLFAENRYQEYLLLHGLGVEMAEALAEYWHRRIREEWGFADEDGPIDRRPVPPAVPRRPLLVGLPGVPRPRGQRHGGRPAAAPSGSASR